MRLLDTFILAAIRNFGTRRIVAIKRASGGRTVSERGSEPKRDQPPNKMTREEAERLRALLRGTKAADLNDPFARQRLGTAIAQAIYRGPKLNFRDTKKD